MSTLPWKVDEYTEGKHGDPMFLVVDAGGRTVADVYDRADAETIARQASVIESLTLACRNAVATLYIRQHQKMSPSEKECERALCQAINQSEGRPT